MARHFRRRPSKPCLQHYNRQEFLHDSVVGSHNFLTPKERKRKYLISQLPAEVLVNILAWLPPDNWFHVGHLSRFWRSFLKGNGPLICNNSIRLLFPKQAALLQCQLLDGWLVSTFPELSRLETTLQSNFLRKSQHPQVWQFRTTIRDPGPNLLYMLHHGLVVGSHSMRSGGPGPAEMLNVYLGGRWVLQLCLKDLFEINGVDWRGVPGVGKDGFTGSRMRGLVWWYGVPSQVVSEQRAMGSKVN